MARFLCKCGETLSNSYVPNEVQFHVYTDREWVEIISQNAIDPLMIPSPKYDVWHCAKCSRVHVFDGDTIFRTYIVEGKIKMRRKWILFVAIFLIIIAVLIVYFSIKINDSRIVDLRLVQEGGGYSPEVYLTLDQSGKLEFYLAEPGVPLDKVHRDNRSDIIHQIILLNPAETSEIKRIAKQIFWDVWFTYDGKRIEGDHEGFWRREVDIDGKRYGWYNYPYTDNKLNLLVSKLLTHAPYDILVDQYGNVVFDSIVDIPS